MELSKSNMTQAAFFALRLNFEDIKQSVSNPELTGLIFQPSFTSENGSINFTLVYYEMLENDPNPPVMKNLEVISGTEFTPGDPVQLGNLPLSREAIQQLIEGSPDEEYLYFWPKQYGDYVSYTITTNSQNSVARSLAFGAEADFEIKPSPPAR